MLVIAEDTDRLTYSPPTSPDAEYSLELTSRGGEVFFGEGERLPLMHQSANLGQRET